MLQPAPLTTRVVASAERLELTLRRRPSPLVGVAGFLLLWLSFGCSQLVAALWHRAGGRAFGLAWLLVMTPLLLLLGRQFCWQVAIRETVIVEARLLLLRRSFLGRSETRQFELEQLHQLRRVGSAEGPDFDHSSYQRALGRALAFDYYGETIEFGNYMNEGEALRVYTLLGKQLEHARQQAAQLR